MNPFSLFNYFITIRLQASVWKTPIIALGLISLNACSEGPASKEGQGRSGKNDCPPVYKSGLSAIERVGGIDNFEKFNKWQTSLPPKSCAGELSAFIPDLPDGYGLPPTGKPPIVNEQHVYLRYVKMPNSDSGQALEFINFADQPQYEFEIVKLTKEQKNKFEDWFKENPKSYREYPIDDRMYYAVGGGGWYLPGNKLTGGIGTLLDNNVLIKFSMPKMYTDKVVAEPVARMFHEIAKNHGY